MSSTKPDSSLSVVLQFDKGSGYARGIVAGVSQFARAGRLDWRLTVASAAEVRTRNISADAWIVDFDDREACARLLQGTEALVAVASSRSAEAGCPPRVPLVMSDNAAMVDMAREHLQDRGVPALAFFSKGKYAGLSWALEREKAFREIPGVEEANILDSQRMSHAGPEGLRDWLRALPRPCGVIAVNDSSAQDLLHECALAGISVPDELAVVGIDNDELVASLAHVEISSVVQDTGRVGRIAAQMLHARLQRSVLPDYRVTVPPARLSIKASSMYQEGVNPVVTRARAFILQFAAHGIKSDQVAHHVNVSRSSIERIFSRECGCSVHDEILRVRLDTAKQLLRAGKLSASEIAVRSGFRTLQYMHVVFKRELGCTPGEFQSGQARQTA
ncbi:MAG: substrate-binding domain-containing protein [Rhodocyclaceae bacterium]